MKVITLTNGKVALVDDEDFERVVKLKWYCCKKKNCTEYAGINDYTESKKVSKTMLMHRFILNAEKGAIVDHINGNGLDNRRCNLRVVSPAENQWNFHRKAWGKSKFMGVSWVNNRWCARIRCNNKQIYLGSFATEKEAALAYNKASIKYRGSFGNLNTIEDTL